MATPNVDFYQHQKDLQDQVTKSEQERMQLDRQLKLLLQSDQNNSQMKSAKIQTYWRKVCVDEKRAQQRNAMLVREFERIDTHLSSMAARTQRLNFLKQQYADYVARTYPQWTRKVEQKMRGETEQESKDAAGIRRSQDWSQAEKEDTSSQQRPQATQQKHAPQQQQQSQWMARLSRDESSAGDDGSSGLATVAQPIQSVSVQRVASPGNKMGDVSNISARKAASVSPSLQQQQQQQQHATDVKQPAVYSAREDSVKSDYVNINQFSNQQAGTPAHAGQGDHHAADKDDLSDFGSGSDLPLSAGDASPVKVTVSRDSQHGVDETRVRAGSVRSIRSSGSLLPELTVDGLIRLLRHIEAGVDRGRQQGAEYYGSPIFDAEEKIDLIQRANAGGALQGLSGPKASNLVLEQMSHVVRSLPEECLIGEQMLKQPLRQITARSIGDSLTGESQAMWVSVFDHFNRLLGAGVMEPKEIAAVFVPCIVRDGSQHQDKAFTVLVNLLEGGDVTDASSMASPRHPYNNSNSLMDDGRVPPLKFGSLVDKPFSDDESSFFDQSVPKEPAVPLNETSAYKQMLSGTFTRSPQKVVVTSDDTDDDVEKEFANVLSPKSPTRPKLSQPSPRVEPQRQASEEDMSSELSSPAGPKSPKSPVYVPTAVEQRTGGFGSTGSSQGQRRTGGLRLGSDFDTSDSEMEQKMFGSSKKPASEDKDDFDFYD